MPHTTSRAHGISIYYEQHGPTDGVPLMLMMGLGADVSGWLRNRDAFTHKYRVLVHDNRGVGRSDKPPGPYLTCDMAQDALSVLDHAGVESAHVVGLSMGGLIAQELTLAAPERVRSLVLASTFGHAD